jgi:hypothetical protein
MIITGTAQRAIWCAKLTGESISEGIGGRNKENSGKTLALWIFPG